MKPREGSCRPGSVEPGEGCGQPLGGSVAGSLPHFSIPVEGIIALGGTQDSGDLEKTEICEVLE